MIMRNEGVAQVPQQDVYPALILGLGKRGRQAVEALPLYIEPSCQDLRLFQTAVLERISGGGQWMLDTGGQQDTVSDWAALQRRLDAGLKVACRTDAVREAASRGLQPDTTTRFTYLVACLADEERADLLALCYLLRVISSSQGEIGFHNCLLLQVPPILDMSPEVRAGAYAALQEIDHVVQVSEYAYAAPWGGQLSSPPFHCSWLFLEENRTGETIPHGAPEAHLLAASLAAFLSPGIGQAVHRWHMQHALLPPEVHGRLGAYGSCGAAILDLPLTSIREKLAQDLKARLISGILLADHENLVVEPTPAQFLRDHNLTEESCHELLPADFQETIRSRLNPWAFPVDPEDSLLERVDGESEYLEREITSARGRWDEESSRAAAGLEQGVRAFVGDIIGESMAGIRTGRSFLERVVKAVSGLTSAGAVHRTVRERRAQRLFGLSDERREQRGLLEEKLWELKALFERRFLPRVSSHVFSLLMGVATFVILPWLFVEAGQSTAGEHWTGEGLTLVGGIVLMGLAVACLIFGAYLEERWSRFELGAVLSEIFHRDVEVPQTRALGMALAGIVVMSGVAVLMVVGPFDWSAEDFRWRWLTLGSLVFLAGTLLTWVGPTFAAALRDMLRGTRPARQPRQSSEELPVFKSLNGEEQSELEQTIGPQGQEGWQPGSPNNVLAEDVAAEPEEYPWKRSLIDWVAARLQTIIFWWGILIAFPVFLAMTLLSPAKERGQELGFSEFLGLLGRLLVSARWETVLVLLLGLGLMAITIDVLSHLLMWSLQRRQVAEARNAYLTAALSYSAELLDLQRFDSSAVIFDALSGLLDRSHQHLVSVENALERQVERTSAKGNLDAAAPKKEASHIRPPWIPTLDVTNGQELDEFLVKCLGGPWESQIVEVTQVAAEQICRDGRLFRNWYDISAEGIMAEIETRTRDRVDALLGTDLEEVFFRRHDQPSVALLSDEVRRFCAPWWNFPADMEVDAKMASPILFVAAAAEEASVLRLFPQARVVPIADRLRCICLGAEQHLPLTCLPFLDELRDAYAGQDEESKDRLHTLADWRDTAEL